MFRLATVNDMVELIGWKRANGAQVASPWGLKRFGMLLAERMIDTYRPATVLEVGVGFTKRFHDLLTPGTEYWTLDRSGFYDPDLFRQGLERRPNATHVDALLGEFNEELPDSRFQLVFSISALEHSEPANARTICEDLFRITATGGLTVHTIDAPVNKPELRFDPWLDAFRAAGFEPLEPAMMSNGLHGLHQSALLVEPLETRLRYFRDKDQFWEDPPLMRDQIGTIMVVCRKPGKLAAVAERSEPKADEPPSIAPTSPPGFEAGIDAPAEPDPAD